MSKHAKTAYHGDIPDDPTPEQEVVLSALIAERAEALKRKALKKMGAREEPENISKKFHAGR